MDEHNDTQTYANDSATSSPISTRLAQWCSPDVPEALESVGAFAALNAKAKSQGITRFFDDPIHVRRQLIAKRFAIGADTPRGHAASNLVEQLQNLITAEGFQRDNLLKAIPYQMARLAGQ
jgi:hypothetical protein